MASPLDSLGLSNIGKGFNLSIILYVLIGCVILIFGILMYKKIRDMKKFNILVKVTPVWSISNLVLDEKGQTQELSKFQKIIGQKKSDNNLIRQDFSQGTASYLVAGAYVFNKEQGYYYIQFKDKAKTKTGGIEYRDSRTKQPYFEDISYGKFKRYIELVRYSPDDFKPVMGRFDAEQLAKIKNVHDQEATFVAIHTQQEVINRFKKGSKWMQYAPLVGMIVIAFVMIIGIYLQWQWIKDYSKSITGLTAAIGDYTKALLVTKP